MTELLTAAQMRALEQAAIASGQVTGLELMERAGAGVVQAILAEWPAFALHPGKAVVLCGPGNNGGDGFVVARLLRDSGWEVDLFLYGDPDHLPPDAQQNHRRWSEGGAVHLLSRPVATADQIRAFCEAASHVPDLRQSPSIPGPHRPFVVVDALFGIGQSRPLAGLDDLIWHWDYLVTFRDLMVARIVAVDVPSGLCSDTGNRITKPTDHPIGILSADLTVTFHAAKTGHWLGEGPLYAGKLVVADIGLRPDKALTGLPVRLLDAPSAIGLGKGHKAHKFDHGHALVLSGPSGRGGAARLAARGALRIGAGLVTLACPPDAVLEHAARLDAVMLDSFDGPDALIERLTDRRITSVVIGPGLGFGPDARAMLAAVLDDCRVNPRPSGNPTVGTWDTWFNRSVVLDADALTLIARDPALFALLHDQCVLTPHGGEFSRLFPDLSERLAAQVAGFSKVDATRAAAARAGCVVLFKGADTVVADPRGPVAISSAAYDRTAPWLATAGSGDVLAGFIGGLLARRLAPFHAAQTAAWLHVECARSFGPGLIAEDLADELPKVFRALGM